MTSLSWPAALVPLEGLEDHWVSLVVLYELVIGLPKRVLFKFLPLLLAHYINWSFSGLPLKQGLGVGPIVQQNQEFSIQNEDFPALPGYKGCHVLSSLCLALFSIIILWRINCHIRNVSFFAPFFLGRTLQQSVLVIILWMAHLVLTINFVPHKELGTSCNLSMFIALNSSCLGLICICMHVCFLTRCVQCINAC